MTNAELAILSLVAEKPRHGYEIEQVIEERNMREWTEVGFSSIYYLLKKLERRGWVRSKTQTAEGRGPARKVYQITAQGVEAWRAAIEQALSQAQGSGLDILLGLSNLPALPGGRAISALRVYLQGLLARRQRLQQRSAEIPPRAGHVIAMFDYSLRLVQTEIEWIQEYIARLEAQNE